LDLKIGEKMFTTKIKESYFPMPPFIQKHIEYLETRSRMLNEIQVVLGASDEEMKIVLNFCDSCIDVFSVGKLVRSGKMTLDKFKDWKIQREERANNG
jgi:hypothetical protein